MYQLDQKLLKRHLLLMLHLVLIYLKYQLGLKHRLRLRHHLVLKFQNDLIILKVLKFLLGLMLR
jgi:hypothetical protein